MEEKKLTDEEIVKALDKCFAKKGEMSCKDCKVYTGEGLRDCMSNVAIPALDLINRQKAEIERLKQSNKNILFVNEYTMKQNAEIQKQVDELKERLQFAEEVWEEDCDDDLENFYEQVVKGTAKEILDEFYLWIGQDFDDMPDGGFIHIMKEDFKRRMDELLKRYGVEVE